MRTRLVAVAVVAVATVMAPAQAANGDNVTTIIADRTGTACVSIDASGNHAAVGVGVAFNGTRLLLSCSDDSSVTEVSPTTGAQIAVHFIGGANFLGALAWDANANQLWGCSDFGTVGIVDLTLDTFTPVFDTYTNGGTGCFDGLAYDGSDDTIWASGDVSSTVEHFDYSVPALLGSFAAVNGGAGNSGIAVGTTQIYLANDGNQQIWEVPKDFSAAATLFASFPARLEDLECDPITFFASLGVGAIWSCDAYDNILNAWEIPPDQCPFAGGGDIFGACCHADVCTIETQDNCESTGGVYQGDDSVCGPDTCEPGVVPATSRTGTAAIFLALAAALALVTALAGLPVRRQRGGRR